MSASEIVEGWTNYIKSKKSKALSPDIEKIADERASICGNCDELICKPIKIFKKEISKYRCGMCGCSFPMMVFSMKKKCPLDKWKK